MYVGRTRLDASQLPFGNDVSLDKTEPSITESAPAVSLNCLSAMMSLWTGCGFGDFVWRINASQLPFGNDVSLDKDEVSMKIKTQRIVSIAFRQ